MGKLCCGSVVVLILIIAGMLYKFVVQGDVIINADTRVAIQLDPNERDLVLSEMRVFLDSVRQIVKGISDDDMMLVAAGAKRSGRSAQLEVPGALISKLPLSFKKLGFDTHARFDELALDAEQFGDRGQTLSQLSDLMNNCISCHSAFGFDIAQKR